MTALVVEALQVVGSFYGTLACGAVIGWFAHALFAGAHE